MKKVSPLVIGLMILIYSVKGQNPFISCLINFEDNPCWEASYSEVIIQGTNNIWQICTPGKSIFDSAHSLPHAILTDSSGSYPINTNSSFTIKFLLEPGCECWPVIGGYYKLDSDTLNDYGKIEISIDYGTTWHNALTDTVIWLFWVTPKPVLTGRVHNWTEFYVIVQGIPHNDTIYYRFTFNSDSIQSNKEGWMLDDISLVEHIEYIKNPDNHNDINILPNPATDLIRIKSSLIDNESEIFIYNYLGRLCQHYRQSPGNEMNVSNLAPGVYMAIVYIKNDCLIKKFVKL